MSPSTISEQYSAGPNLRATADNGGEMKYRIGVECHDALDDRGIGEVAGDRGDARIGDRCRCHVEQHQLPQRATLPCSVDEILSLEQLASETGAEETGAAGDHDAHRGLHVIRAIRRRASVARAEGRIIR